MRPPAPSTKALLQLKCGDLHSQLCDAKNWNGLGVPCACRVQCLRCNSRTAPGTMYSGCVWLFTILVSLAAVESGECRVFNSAGSDLSLVLTTLYRSLGCVSRSAALATIEHLLLSPLERPRRLPPVALFIRKQLNRNLISGRAKWIDFPRERVALSVSSPLRRFSLQLENSRAYKDDTTAI